MLQFDYTNQIKRALLQMVKDHGEGILDDEKRFISLMNDYIPEYERERRLFKHVLSNNILPQMRRDDNQRIAILKAREFMSNELFLADTAVEFVLTCFTYMMEWNYVSPTPQAAQPAAAAPADQTAQQPAAAAPAAQPAAAPAPAKPVTSEVLYTKNDAKRASGLFNTTARVPEGYTTIEDFAFDSSRIKAVELPTSLYVIGEYAFSDCKKLKSLELPVNIKRIGKGAFSSCAKLSMVRIPAGVTEIEESTFQFCTGLEVLDLPNTISSIGAEAFQGCMSLKKLFLNDSVKYIDDTAFKMCPDLTIKCYENSYVHRFCEEHRMRYEVVRKGFRG